MTNAIAEAAVAADVAIDHSVAIASEIAPIVSLSRVEANRRNALRSTGPRTPAGRVRSAQNARKHGLLCAPSIIGGESRYEYAALHRRLWDDLQPVGAVEELLVDRVISCAWRLRRAVYVDSVLMEIERKDQGVCGREPASPSNAFARHETTMEVVSRYEAAIERSMYKALDNLRMVQERAMRHWQRVASSPEISK